jgi:hypothetical protein
VIEIRVDSAAASTPTTMMLRPPLTIWRKTSRPSESVPNGCSQLGGW